MSVYTDKLAQRFRTIHEHVDLAQTYAEDGARMSAMQLLVEAIDTIRGMIEPGPDETPQYVPLENLVAMVEGALHRQTPEQVATVPRVAEAIGVHAPDIRALGEAAAEAEQKYRAALVEWISRDWTCLCVVNCTDDPATACSLSGREHVHPAIPGRPGVYGPCPVHPDAPGDR